MQQALSGFIDQLVTDPRLAAPLRSLAGTVLKVSVRPSGQLRIQIGTDERLPGPLLCQLEAALEQSLGVSEVLVCQNKAGAGRSRRMAGSDGPTYPEDKPDGLQVADRPLAPVYAAAPAGTARVTQMPATRKGAPADILSAERDAEYLAGLSEWILRHLWHEDAFHAAMLRQARFVARNGAVIIEMPHECCSEENETLLAILDRLGGFALHRPVPFRLEPVRFDLLTQALADAEQQTRETAQLRQQAEPAGTSGPANGHGSRGNGGSRGPGAASGGHNGGHNGAKAIPSSDRGPAGGGSGAPGSRSGAGQGANGAARNYRRAPSQPGQIWGRMNPALSRSQIADINSQSGIVSMTGEVLNLECRVISDGFRLLVKFDLTDYSHTVQCIIFAKPEDQEPLEGKLKGACVTVNAEIRVDARYSGELQANVVGITEAEKPRGRSDDAPVKRVELHCHTKMSARDAVCDAEDVIRLAARFGHESVAITDHGVVQSFPEARRAALDCARKGKPIKVIYGMEGYLVDDGPTVAYNCTGVGLDEGFIALDVETTGLDAATDRIIEIAAVRFVPAGIPDPEAPAGPFAGQPAGESAGHLAGESAGHPAGESAGQPAGLSDAAAGTPADSGCEPACGLSPEAARAGRFRVAEVWRTFVDPGRPIPARTTELTGITDAMVAGAPGHGAALSRLQTFLCGLPVVAHNAFFDLGFLRYEGFRTPEETDPRLKFNPPLIDTLCLARHFLPDLCNHKLTTVAAALGIDMGRAHRALDDALACGRILAALVEQAIIPDEQGGTDLPTLDGLNGLVGHLTAEQILEHRRPVNHIVLLAQDPLGLYHLYRLVSESHVRHFHRRPRMPRSLLAYFRAGLLLGAACDQGEVFQGVLNLYRQAGNDFGQAAAALDTPSLIERARFYDYLEIQPLTNNSYCLRDPDSGLHQPADLENLNRLVVRLGERTRRPVCATCDVHFLEPRDEVYRRILQADQDYDDADLQAELFFRTTGEMLGAFAYLGEAKAREVVIDAPRRIVERVLPDLKPFPDGSFPPIIPEAADQVRAIVNGTAQAMYGRNGVLPDAVQRRIDQELKSIIDNGFAIMYYIAHHLVKKSNDDGYIVGSRGSVGSSLAATLCGITEVNPLPPHYVCPDCHHSEFLETGSFGSGYDMPPKDCPECGAALLREGQDIPFETFLGFDGDKQPDIDLNFSGDYQPRAHRFIEEMFGSSHTFRAGTIGGFADKNAQAMVGKYFQKRQQAVTQAEVARLARGLVGVKRTTGQHPGGIVVVPKEREIYDFTPVQFPADKTDALMVTTHFDFNAMHDTILKLDVLGHDDPTMLKVLGDMTGIDVRDIPVPDERVMSLFQSTDALGIPDGTSPAKSATLGLPELGTFMARDMIRETRPTRFYDLVQLMGLSHGTDVWKGNAQELIRSGTCTIEAVIGCRDSIMTYLIHKNLPAKAAFDIMEKVRKGKGLSAQQEELMQSCDVPEWYIQSCKKIKYMFPKAHAAAYTISSLRIAWFKVYRPVAYYCAYFTVRADEFDAGLMTRGLAIVRRERERLQAMFRDATDREQKIFYILEIVEEMHLRGISFLPLDLYRSDAYRFLPEGENAIRPPLASVSGVSRALADNVVAARSAGPFKSRDELANRAGAGSAAIETLAAAGCLDGLPQSAQIDLFEFLGQ